MINHLHFGLTSNIWNNNLSKALRLISQIEAGSIWINMHTFLDPAASKHQGLAVNFQMFYRGLYLVKIGDDSLLRSAEFVKSRFNEAYYDE